MDFLREIVGGPKNRFKENGYNLDLTYITDRIVAMAYPASGIEKLYRNSVDSIRQLLENAHQNKYMTINISGRSIQQGKLQNVVSYDWQDHKAPSFDTLFTICMQVTKFLLADVERIAVFHCNHGKGRTGTIICCFFLFLGQFKETSDVMKFYAERRFASEGYGVTQPCQILYIKYFQSILQEPTLYPRIMTLKSIKFKGSFNFNQPYVKMYRMGGKSISYNSKESGQHFQQINQELILRVKHDVVLVGDISFEIKQNKSVGHNLLITYIFNTAFCKEQQKLIIPLKQLSPLGKQKLNNFGQDFAIEIDLVQTCSCGQKKNCHGCALCKGILKEQFAKWERIENVLKFRKTLEGKGNQIGFGKKQIQEY